MNATPSIALGSASRAGRVLSAWLSALVVAGCIVGSIAMLSAYLHRGPTAQVLATRDRNPADGIKRQNPDHWRITCGPATLAIDRRRHHAPVTRSPTTRLIEAPLEMEFTFERYEFLTSEQVQTLTQIRRLAQSQKIEKYLGLSPTVIQEVEKLRAGAAIRLDAADQSRMRDLFGQYVIAEAALDAKNAELDRLEKSPDTAPASPAKRTNERAIELALEEADRLESQRIALERLVVQLTSQIADRVFPSVRASAVDRAARSQVLLTDAQWKQLRSLPQR